MSDPGRGLWRRSTSCAVAAGIAMLLGCGGGPVVVTPEDLPPIEAAWADLTLQLPARTDAVFLASLDEAAQAELSQVMTALDAVTGATQPLSDVLGIDLSSPEAFRQLGLRLGGAAAYALDGGRWVFLVELSEPDAMRRLLEGLGGRNPDLDLQWREVEGHDVLRIELPPGALGAPDTQRRLYLTVTDEQIVGLMSPIRFGQPDDAVDYLIASLEPRADNLRFNRDFARAIRHHGGSSWGLYVVQTGPLLDLIAELAAADGGALGSPFGVADEDLDVGGLFGASPGAERCAEVARATAIAVPVADGIIERERVSDPQGVHERQRMRLHVAPAYHQRAAELLRAPRIDQGALAEGPPVAGYLRLDRDVMVEHVAQFSDAAACGAPANLTGLLARGASLLGDGDSIGSQVDGLVLGALFDLRNTGGVPFTDLFVGLGSEEPASLSQSVQRLFESELGLNGSPEVVAGYQTIHYRFALLYRVALIEGSRLLGVTMGLVNQSWLQAILAPTESDTGSFLWFHLDGERMQSIYDTVVALALMGVEDDAMRESQRQFMESSMAELRRLRYFEMSGSYDGGVITLETDERSTEPVSAGAIQAAAP